MSFKKHNPGCPCDCANDVGPCGCNSTQIQVDITNADDIVTIQGVRFIGGPCDYLDFEGFSDVNGTYYVDWPEPGTTVELWRGGSTNGPLEDSTGTKYCVHAKLELFVPEATPCFGFLYFCISIETLVYPDTACTDTADWPFNTGCVDLNPGSFGEDNDFDIALCVADSKSISMQTTDDSDCDFKYYNIDMAVSPV